MVVMQAINRVRQRVWKQQEDRFFDCATIEADGTIVETAAEKKEGIGISYKGKWGYHPLVVTLAETKNCSTSTIALAIGDVRSVVETRDGLTLQKGIFFKISGKRARRE